MMHKIWFNLCLSAILMTMAGANLAAGMLDRSAYASDPLCGGIPAPGEDCACCEECGCWYCID